MKKNVLFVSVLMMSMLLSSCGQGDNAGSADALSDTAGREVQASVMSEPGVSGTGEPFQGDNSQGNLTGEDPKAAVLGAEGEMEEFVEEDVLLSDKILKAGDTMQVMYFNGDGVLYAGLEVTLRGAQLFDSPEAAPMDRTRMVAETENYDVEGNPEFYSIDEARILVCDLTVKNLGGNSKEDALGMETDQHISELMIAYADPVTRKVTIVSCMPAYFSASVSQAGASDYYHYQLPEGESKDMTVAWAIQEGYEAENLFLCVNYDSREPEERQYFRVTE